MKLSIIIPVYNEQDYISEIIRLVKEVSLVGIEKEIIVVDDCSTDNTSLILSSAQDIKVVRHDKNMGKGSAVRTGISNSTGDIILIQDADMEYNPKEYPLLIRPIMENKTYVVYGSRFLNNSLNLIGNGRIIIPSHLIGNRFLTLVTWLLYNTKITDMETCYKVFKRNILKGIKLKAKRFDFEPEITSKILRKGYRIYEVPISYKPRNFKDGKKITLFDGVKALYYLIKYRFFD